MREWNEERKETCWISKLVGLCSSPGVNKFVNHSATALHLASFLDLSDWIAPAAMKTQTQKSKSFGQTREQIKWDSVTADHCNLRINQIVLHFAFPKEFFND